MATFKTETSCIRPALLKMLPKFDPPTEGLLRHQGLDAAKIRPMGLNENIFPPSPAVLEAIERNLKKIGRYPDAQPPHLSDKISKMFSVEASNIVWGNGSEELIKGAIDLSVSPGDGLVLPVPTFWGYRGLIAAAEANPSFVYSEADGRVDVDAITGFIGNRTKIVICVTPNNPSGAILSEEDLAKLAKDIPNEVLFVVDEAYFEFGKYAGGPDVVELVKNRQGPWIIIRTFSKAYAMAGMRIGYAICSNEELAQALIKTTCVFNVPILSIVAAEAALNDTHHLRFMMESVEAGRNQLTTGLKKLGYSPLPSATNFVSVKVPIPGSQVVSEMLKRHIQIHAWPDPGYEKFIRITVGTPQDNEVCLETLRKVVSGGP